MNLLAIDTATEQCSVALRHQGNTLERCMPTARGHAEIILPMVQEVLAEAGLSMQQLDAIAFGRGPGAFTGVRIAIGVAQGLAYACDLPVVPISNLAAVAQQAAGVTGSILVCMDARMAEVYWGVFATAIDGLVAPTGQEQVDAPESVVLVNQLAGVGLGTGFRAYPILRECFASLRIDADALPRAAHIALLAERDFANGLAIEAAAASPVYLRDQVAHVKSV